MLTSPTTARRVKCFLNNNINYSYLTKWFRWADYETQIPKIPNHFIAFQCIKRKLKAKVSLTYEAFDDVTFQSYIFWDEVHLIIALNARLTNKCQMGSGLVPRKIKLKHLERYFFVSHHCIWVTLKETLADWSTKALPLTSTSIKQANNMNEPKNCICSERIIDVTQYWTFRIFSS